MKEHGQATSETWEGYVDWRNRPALRRKHGGKLAASFVLATEVLENLAFVANASNMVSYVLHDMHFTPALAANAITNFIGTAFFLALLGGFLYDALCNSYIIYLLSATVEFLGLAVLFIQARTPSLKPPKCDHETGPCEMLSGGNATLFYAGLYLVALGMGGIKGSLPAQGEDQFDESTAQGRKDLSTFFNYFVFCLNLGGLVAVTFVVWVEDNLGWMWGFAITIVSILLSIPVFLASSSTYRNKIPKGSPLTTIAKVICAAIFNTKATQNPNAIVDMATPPPSWTSMGGQKDHSKYEEEDAILKEQASPSSQKKIRSLGGFLARAVEREPALHALVCTVEEVEEVKVVVGLMPTFLCTIMFSCCLAQLNTFSVQQAATMNTKMGSLTVPPASLPVFPIVFMLILVPLYDHAIVPFACKITGTEAGITHLPRIGVGLVLSIAAMAVAGFVEVMRKDVATQMGMLDSKAPLPISFLWVAPQYLLLGSADLFTLAGLLEFFFTEAPIGMRSLSTALSWASLALGQYVSSFLVFIVNSVTGDGGHKAWLSEHSLNHNRLENFYWLMTAMGIANFLIYIVLSMRYKYRSSSTHNS
ncbi:hypothetical protein Taro_033598 [Colocasia esculenta]|uniref:Uncharacterized protein n=1 Tax=Colocasia esculenta TaxID=4460 RepID=A0A843W1X2_COLES|nr:hypothetical protein [Colocasia esculenta]